MKLRSIRPLISLFLVVWVLGYQPASAGEPTTESVVHGMSTPDAGNGASSRASLSADGRYVAFTSDASNLVAAVDRVGTPDVFVRDRTAGSTRLVSVSMQGETGDGYSQIPAISGNGSVVAFESYATNLVPDDTNGFTDMFVRDLTLGVTKRVSVASDGTQANGWNREAVISDDGRFVAFTSDATNLVPGDTNGVADVFVHDLTTGETRRVSVGRGGAEANGASYQAALSGDGRFVAFASAASNLVRRDTNGLADVFVRDRLAATTTRVSVTPSGRQADGDSSAPDLSADGRFIAFVSAASNVDGASGGVNNVFLRDNQAGTTRRISNAVGGGVPDGFSDHPRVSNDGSVVVFDSSATNLVVGDGNTLNSDVFVWRAPDASVRIVSNAADGSAAQGTSYLPAMDASGETIAFESLAPNLVAGDTNHETDVFVVTQGTSAIEWISHSPALPRQPDEGSWEPTISGDGRFVAFTSFASNLVPNDTPLTADLFLYDRVTGVTTMVSRATDGGPGDGQSTSARLSTDGRLLAYETAATNLVPGVTTPYHVMLFDLETGSTTVASVCADGSTPISGQPAISGDGRVVAFVTDAPCTADDTNGRSDVFVRDLTTSTTTRASVGLLGEGTGESSRPSLNGDGSVVAFISSSPELVPADRNNSDDVFVRDRTARTTLRVAPAFGLVDPLGFSAWPSLSADGRRLALSSTAPNLVPGDTNVCQSGPGPLVQLPGTCADVFVYDRISGLFTRASVASDGTQSDGWSGASTLSPDGTTVAFASNGTTLVSGDTNRTYDVFLHDLVTGATELVSVAPDGAPANGSSYGPSLSANGGLVAFDSTATNIVPNGPGERSIYVRIR